MVKVYADMGMSLDGYVGGPNAGPQNALGDGGMLLHRWVFDLESWRERQSLPGGRTNQDDEVVKEKNARNGAFVMGRRMFDEGEVGWPDPPPFQAPVFVLTHHAREPWVRQGRHDLHLRHRRHRERRGAGEGGRGRQRRPDSWEARTRSNSPSKPGCSTNCRSTSPPCCSATGSDCSSGWALRTPNWKARG
jgi:hypothetical protein